MLDRLFGFKIQDYLQVAGLFILAVGLPLSKVLMSIGTIWLAANLLLKYDYKNNWKRWKDSYVFWFVVGLFVLHVIGLSYTQDFNYAFRDINAKLPLFVVPISLIGFPIDKKFKPYILYGFLISLLITSLINFNYIVYNHSADYRDYSRFGSHVRYSLLIVMGILISIYLVYKEKRIWWSLGPIALWFLYYTAISKVFNGYIALISLVIALCLFFIKMIKANKLRQSFMVLFVSVLVLSSWGIYKYLSPDLSNMNHENLSLYSEDGEEYFHRPTSLWMVNGSQVLMYIAEDEIEEAWSKRSNLNLEDTLQNGIQLRNVLYMYMTSKGLKKDKRGFSKMSDLDIKRVEEGVTNIVKTYNPIKSEVIEFKNSIKYYSLGMDPDGNSLVQRFEHWTAAIEIIKRNWLFGVGTGDVQEAFNDQYRNSDTLLDEYNWHRSHNQFLTLWVAFGLIGFLLFLVFWIAFFISNFKANSLLGIGFALIAITSFLSEDTIETQQGVTFIALFLGILAMNSWFQLKKSVK